MTVKRFTVPKNYRCIQDTLTKEHYLCEDKTEAINLAYLLNELSDENEQLKHDATILILSNQDYRKENEQLKQQLRHLEYRFTEYRIKVGDRE